MASVIRRSDTGKVKALIPPPLFNFLAWVVGASDDAEKARFVKTPESKERRLLSIAQDIMFVKNSKKPMPKHYALATAVRHLTGSTKLVGILNGLGHSIGCILMLACVLQTHCSDTHSFRYAKC